MNAEETDCSQTLKISCVDYFNTRFDALEKQLSLRDEAQDAAHIRGEKVLDARLANMDEFRAQLSTQANTFVSKEVFDRDLAVISTKIEASNKILYIGLGIMIAIQVSVPLIIRLLLTAK